MAKKTKKSKVEGQVQENTNQTVKENQMEVTNTDVVPATIVEGSAEQVFSGQAEDQAVSTEGESQVVDGPVVAAEGETSQAQPEEKPTPKPRVNKRPYIQFVTEHLELGDCERKDLVKLVLAEFPQVVKGGIETFLTDCLNPKYSHFKDRSVIKTAAGKMIFKDKAPVEVVAPVAEVKLTETETPPVADVVVPVEEVQPEQPGE
jgi:hypothetical protein